MNYYKVFCMNYSENEFDEVLHGSISIFYLFYYKNPELNILKEHANLRKFMRKYILLAKSKVST